jgi:hypothetical protein
VREKKGVIILEKGDQDADGSPGVVTNAYKDVAI